MTSNNTTPQGTNTVQSSLASVGGPRTRPSPTQGIRSGGTGPRLMEAPLEMPNTTGCRRFPTATYTINPKRYWAAENCSGDMSRRSSQTTKSIARKLSQHRKARLESEPQREKNQISTFPDELWTQIFAFAMHVRDPQEYHLTDALYQEYIDNSVNATRRNISIACKKFHRVSLPYFYAIPILLRSVSVRRFARRICAAPELAALVRVLYLPDIGPITSLCHFPVPLSQVLSGNYGFRALPALADSLKVVPLHQLMAVELPRAPIETSTITFERFTGIRCLTLRGGEATFDPEAVRQESLSTLEILDIHGPRVGLIDALTRASLPSLKSLSVFRCPSDIVLDILKAHGAKLKYLHLDLRWPEDNLERLPIKSLCPNLAKPAYYNTTIPMSERFEALDSVFQSFDDERRRRSTRRLEDGLY